jgi:hypothetical protein
MPTVRCDRCDTVCPEAAVRDGWCENCGKRLPAYLLHQPPTDDAPAAAAAEAEEEAPVPAGDVEFRSAFSARLVAFLVLGAAGLAAAFGPVWIVTHPTRDPRKAGEDVFAAVLTGGVALVALSVAAIRLRAGRLVVGESEVRHTRGWLGGLGPVLVTDRIPYAAVERFGFGYIPEDADLFVTPRRFPTVMFRVGPCPGCPSGGDFRLPLKEYPDTPRIMKLLLARVGRPPELLLPGWHLLGKFR